MDIYSEKDFHMMVRKFNSLSKAFEWKYTTARKAHKDLFGNIIRINQVYLKKNSLIYYDDIKLSYLSMEKLLYAVFHNNFYLHSITEEFCERNNRFDQRT